MSERTKRILCNALKFNENEAINISSDMCLKKKKLISNENNVAASDVSLGYSDSNDTDINTNEPEQHKIEKIATETIPLNEITNIFQVNSKSSLENAILIEVQLPSCQQLPDSLNQSKILDTSIGDIILNIPEDFNYTLGDTGYDYSEDVQATTMSSLCEAITTERVTVENYPVIEALVVEESQEERVRIQDDFTPIATEIDINETFSSKAKDIALNESDVEESEANSDGSIFNPENLSTNSSDSELSSDDIMMDAEEIERNQKLQDERNMWKGRPKKGRHNKYPGQTFATRKKLKDSNRTHYTVNGKLMKSKTFLNFQCNCPKKCNEAVTEQMRETLFNNFWSLASYDSQTGFIAGTIKEMRVKRKRAKNGSGKSYTRVYLLSNVEVCRNMYIKTYNISTKRVNSALTKIREGRLKDERGKLGGKPKTDDLTIQKIVDHINKFPTYISHYSRAETQSKFLAPDLTERKMYELYMEENNPKVSFSLFKRVFYENFNLRRKPPTKDTCNKCDLFITQVKNFSDENKKQAAETAHENHLTCADLARNQMKSDMKEAVSNPLLETLCYDMEKVLGLPKLPTNVVYYKRQLSIYNEGIHSASTNTPYAFIWKEGVAGRGAQEVGSCLKKFVDLYLKQGTEELILWSDSCGGQNRNIKIVLLLKHILSEHPSLKIIYFKYLESGHSFLPNDTDFGQIERALKHQIRIYTLDDFKLIIQNCKKNNPFVVENMALEDFFSVSEVEKRISNRKLTVEKDKVSWLKTKVIRIDKSTPFSIFFKETHFPDAEYKEVDIFKPMRGRKSTNNNNDLGKLTQLYRNGKPISNKKCEDIKSLMRFIPLDARDFYKVDNIQDFQDDVDGFGENPDFQVEIDE